MSRRLFTLMACLGWTLACGERVSFASCQEWDASVREVVANVESALPAGVKGRSFAEDYAFVAEDLELSERLAQCVTQGHLAAADSEPAAGHAASDLAFLDVLEFGAGSNTAVAAMQAAGWSCEAAKAPSGFDGKAQVCAGSYARGEAEVELAFQAGRLARVSLAVHDIPERIQDIVKKTDADVFGARKALIDKVVSDLGSRFADLEKTRDAVEQGGVHLVWQGSAGSRRVQLDFRQQGPYLGFAIEDEAVAREVAAARAQRPEKAAQSYFE